MSRLERWGDCLLGWKVAQDLGLKVGDGLLSEPENLLDLSGPAPLRMHVRGLLNRTGTADDEVIFCHLETTWIMAGIGHGHDVVKTSDQENVVATKDGSVDQVTRAWCREPPALFRNNQRELVKLSLSRSSR